MLCIRVFTSGLDDRGPHAGDAGLFLAAVNVVSAPELSPPLTQSTGEHINKVRKEREPGRCGGGGAGEEVRHSLVFSTCSISINHMIFLFFSTLLVSD